MPRIVKWQALISPHLIVTYLWIIPSPIYQGSTLRPYLKESHRVYALQDAYLGREFYTT